MDLTTNRKILIITAVIVISVFAGTKKFIYQPRTNQFKARLKILDDEYAKNRIFFEIKKTRDAVKGYSKEMLESEKDLPWLLGKISEIFNRLHLEVTSMEPQPLEKTNFYTLIPVKVKTVCSYHSLGELISRLENLEKFIYISRVELRSLTRPSSSRDSSSVSSEEGKKKLIQPRRKLDKNGFVLAELTLKLNALFLNR